MNISLDFDASDITRVTDEIMRWVATDGIDAAITATAKRIVDDAARGTGPQGEAWPAYTPKYARRRAKMGLATSPVNLRVTGGLLGGIGKQSPGLLSVGESHEDIADGLTKKRVFIGASDAALRDVETAISDGINKL